MTGTIPRIRHLSHFSSRTTQRSVVYFDPWLCHNLNRFPGPMLVLVVKLQLLLPGRLDLRWGLQRCIFPTRRPLVVASHCASSYYWSSSRRSRPSSTPDTLTTQLLFSEHATQSPCPHARYWTLSRPASIHSLIYTTSALLASRRGTPTGRRRPEYPTSKSFARHLRGILDFVVDVHRGRENVVTTCTRSPEGRHCHCSSRLETCTFRRRCSNE